MKSLLLCAFALSFSVINLSAQNIAFGIKGGVNIASINDEDRVADGDVTPRTGYHFGGLLHIHLGSHWALQPEVVYSTQGADYDIPSYKGKDKLDYVNVPVLLQFMAGKGFRLQTGPQIGFLTSAKFQTATGTEDIKDDISGPDFSWVFGLGYLFSSGFGVDARYNLGLKNMYKDNIYNGAVAKHRVGQFGIFYQFNQKAKTAK